MATETDYKTIDQADLALRRAALRRAVYRSQGQTISADVAGSIIDRLLDRRLELMPPAPPRPPVAPPAPPAPGVLR